MVVLKEFMYEDHTADIKILGFGNTPKRSIEALLEGMLNIIYDLENVEKIEEKEIEITGDDIKEVMFKLANKVLEVFYVDKFAVREIRIKHLRRIKNREERRVYWLCIAKLYGEKYNKEKHNFKKEVKAATYHDLGIKKIKKAYWISEIIVDV